MNPKVTVCGPRYNLQCIQPHADSLFMLGTLLGSEGWRTHHPIHTHDTIVHHGRNRIMEALLNAPIDIALWLDGDTFWHFSQTRQVLAGFKWTDAHPTTPILTCAYILRDGSPSIWVDGERESDWHNLPDDWGEIDKCGFGMVFMNLNLYRKHWRQGPWFDCAYGKTKASKRLPHLIGEDVWHCEQLERHGLGKPHLYPPNLLMPAHASSNV